jgi:hypothetical protein
MSDSKAPRCMARLIADLASRIKISAAKDTSSASLRQQLVYGLARHLIIMQLTALLAVLVCLQHPCGRCQARSPCRSGGACICTEPP